MNKIAETIDTVYIYITGYNFIKCLYKHKAIFPYAFLRYSKMHG